MDRPSENDIGTYSNGAMGASCGSFQGQWRKYRSVCPIYILAPGTFFGRALESVGKKYMKSALLGT
jgi:hypothetical protein